MTNKRNFDFVNTTISAILLLAAVAMVYPFLYVISASFSHPMVVAENPILLWPRRVTLVSYEMLFSVPVVWLGYFNSIVYTGAGTAMNVSVTMLGAYSLSRPELKGKRYIMFFIVLTMFISGGMIPRYLVVRNLGLLNTRWAVMLPVLVSTWNLFITKTYLQINIPQELHDAAEIDGAGETYFFLKIVLPLSKAIIAVIALFYGTFHWNSFFNALIYLQNRNLYPLQVFLREILLLEQDQDMMGDAAADERSLMLMNLKYAVMVASILPLLVIFPFAQRYFVKGVMIGSLKG